MLYSVTYKLYGETKKNLKDSLIDWAQVHRATSIDVNANDLGYKVEIGFPDEKSMIKFMREIRTILRDLD